jgi:glycosyltransferase involved in cell wall biosynthesis
MHKYQFTVFTPCYNMAHTIHRVIESLRRQTFRDFEWIVVDDGSTDNVYTQIESVINKHEFPVRFFRREHNLGKPGAINLGVEKAEGEFFVIADADDRITDDALEVYHNIYNGLAEDVKGNVAVITANVKDQHGNFVGTRFPIPADDGIVISDIFEMRYKFKVKGDKCNCRKTNVMREFPFNTQVDKFVTENTVWFAIAAKYKAVFTNRVLMIFYINENPNSLSMTGVKKHPLGFVFYLEEIINKYTQKMHLSFLGRIIVYSKFIKYILLAKIKFSGAIAKLNRRHKRFFAYLCIPLGFLAAHTNLHDFEHTS